MNLDHPILNFSENKRSNNDVWTLRDAFRGVQIFGGIGSGKTSGSGYTLAKAFLENGFGGLVLCAKPSERQDWINLAKQIGRESDIKIIYEPKEGGLNSYPEYFFNPLDYESRRPGGGDTFNIVNLFMHIYRMGRLISGDGLGGGGERFWDNALKRCMSRLVDLLKLSGETISVANMYKLISERPSKQSCDRLRELRTKGVEGRKEMLDIARRNYYVFCYLTAEKKQNDIIRANKSTKAEVESFEEKLRIVEKYFEQELPNLAPRTKTIIIESFLGIVEPFQSGILKRYFADKTNITPEECFQDKKIIILDFPIKNYLDAGVYAQGVFKLLWQQAVERREYKQGHTPVFLWVDEAQMFLNSYDQIFQTTARSAGAITVFLSQNISNYYAAFGGKDPKPKVDSLLGNLSTKIFHANNDSVTNKWAAETIGMAIRTMNTYNIAHDGASSGGNSEFQYQVMPVEFTVLGSEYKKKQDQLEFEAVITVAGKRWSDGRNFRKHTFIKKL